LQRPKTAPKRVTLPHTGLDLDKCARAVLDSMTGLIYADDARICDLTLRKRFAVEEPTGATILIERLES
jgi:Holliday junction resolvase RusA-like endonuclease